jgi:hypothetical protein
MSEFNSDRNYKVGRISGTTNQNKKFQDKEVKYAQLGELPIFEGDIVLNPEIMKLVSQGVIISGDQFRWKDGKIPFRIHPTFDHPERVIEAVGHWEANTKIRFIELTTGEDLMKHEDRILFIKDNLNRCYSYVGRQGGEQVIGLGQGCDKGSAIHEIGHAIGLWHEQSREDRDKYITIYYQNIIPGMEHNFDQHIADGEDIGPYDYDSIMHYPTWAFQKEAGLSTIITKNGAPIGQRDRLSAGDLAAVEAMYPNL